MKKIIILSIIALSLATAFNACTTYDEGPGFTVLPAETRLKGTWDQTAIHIEGQLREENDMGLEFTFNSDGTGTLVETILFFGATAEVDIVWELNEDKTKVLFKASDAEEGAAWDEATILRLTTSEMWLTHEKLLFGTLELHYEKV